MRQPRENWLSSLSEVCALPSFIIILVTIKLMVEKVEQPQHPHIEARLSKEKNIKVYEDNDRFFDVLWEHIDNA